MLLVPLVFYGFTLIGVGFNTGAGPMKTLELLYRLEIPTRSKSMSKIV